MPKRPDRCHLETAFRVMGRSCKALVLFELFRGVARFNQLQRTLPGVTPRTLSRTLKELERDGLVAKTTWPGNLPKTEYRLTETGKTLRPIIDAMQRWGGDYTARTEIATRSS